MLNIDKLIITSAQISKRVEGGMGIEIGYLFNAHPPFKREISQVELL